jgi:hypothetical protein
MHPAWNHIIGQFNTQQPIKLFCLHTMAQQVKIGNVTVYILREKPIAFSAKGIGDVIEISHYQELWAERYFSQIWKKESFMPKLAIGGTPFSFLLESVLKQAFNTDLAEVMLNSLNAEKAYNEAYPTQRLRYPS